MTHTDAAPIAPLLLSIPAAAARLGVGRSMVYELMNSRELPSVKIGKRRMIADAEIRSLIERLSSAANQGADTAFDYDYE